VMEKPERRYNLLSCLVLGVIGAVLGGLAISGAIYPVTVYLLDLLPSGNWGIPPEVFDVVCNAVAYGVPIVLLVVWLLRRRSRMGAARAEQLERRARLDTLLNKDDKEG